MNEQRVIGIIANNPDQFFVANDLLTMTDFTDLHAAECWKAMCELHKRDMPTAFIYLAKQVSEHAAEWLGVIKEQVYGANVEPYCKSLLDEKREALFKHAIAIAGNQDSPAQFLEDAIEQYRDVTTNTSQTFKELISATADHIEEISEGGNGIKTGIRCIDAQMGGLQNARVMIVAARTGVGKTALANQIALHIAKHEIGVGVMSLEMGAAELGMRAISHTCQADIGGLYRADDMALGKMSAGMVKEQLANWNMHFNTEQYRLNEVISQIRVWVKKDKVKLAIVDHIGLVEVPEAKNANERLGMVTRSMKKLAKELDIPIILVSQLNRSNDKENRPPRLSDLRDSGSIEQDADIVLLMHRVVEADRVNGKPVYMRHDFIMAKNRQGGTGTLDAVIRFNGQMQTFVEEISHAY